MKTKEQVYDEEINPLIAQIIEICKREKIAMLATFRIPNAEDPHLNCTTALLDDSHEPSKEQLASLELIQHGFVAFAMRTRKA